MNDALGLVLINQQVRWQPLLPRPSPRRKAHATPLRRLAVHHSRLPAAAVVGNVGLGRVPLTPIPLRAWQLPQVGPRRVGHLAVALVLSMC